MHIYYDIYHTTPVGSADVLINNAFSLREKNDAEFPGAIEAIGNDTLIEVKKLLAATSKPSAKEFSEILAGILMAKKEVVRRMKAVEERARRRTDVQHGFRMWAIEAAGGTDLTEPLKQYEQGNQGIRNKALSTTNFDFLVSRLEDAQLKIIAAFEDGREREGDTSLKKLQIAGEALASLAEDCPRGTKLPPNFSSTLYSAIFDDASQSEAALDSIETVLKDATVSDEKRQFIIEQLRSQRDLAQEVPPKVKHGWMARADIIKQVTKPEVVRPKDDNPWLGQLCNTQKKKTVELTTDTGAHFLLYIDGEGEYHVLTSSMPRSYVPKTYNSKLAKEVVAGESDAGNVEWPTSKPLYIHVYPEARVREALDALPNGYSMSCKVASKKSYDLIPATISKDKEGKLSISDTDEHKGFMRKITFRNSKNTPSIDEIQKNPGRWIHPQTLQLLPPKKQKKPLVLDAIATTPDADASDSRSPDSDTTT